MRVAEIRVIEKSVLSSPGANGTATPHNRIGMVLQKMQFVHILQHHTNRSERAVAISIRRTNLVAKLRMLFFRFVAWLRGKETQVALDIVE